MSANVAIKICPTCKERERHDDSAWCLICRRERARKRRAVTVDGRTPGKPCSKCKAVPARLHSSYCADCGREYQRRYTGRANPRPPGTRVLHPDACNCRNPNCDGLRCDSLRHGTAA